MPSTETQRISDVVLPCLPDLALLAQQPQMRGDVSQGAWGLGRASHRPAAHLSGAHLQEARGLLEHRPLIGGQVAGGDAGAGEVRLQQRVDLGVRVCPLGRIDGQRRMQQQLPHLVILACTDSRSRFTRVSCAAPLF